MSIVYHELHYHNHHYDGIVTLKYSQSTCPIPRRSLLTALGSNFPFLSNSISSPSQQFPSSLLPSSITLHTLPSITLKNGCPRPPNAHHRPAASSALTIQLPQNPIPDNLQFRISTALAGGSGACASLSTAFWLCKGLYGYGQLCEVDADAGVVGGCACCAG